MKSRTRLGRLVENEQQPRRRRRWRFPLLIAGLVAASALVTLGCLTGWLPAQFVPRGLIIRGNYLTPSAEVASALGFTGRETYLELWRNAHSRQLVPSPWLKSLRLRPLTAGYLLVEAQEHLPLVPLAVPGRSYWLCDDGQLVPEEAFAGSSAQLPDKSKLPRIELPDDPGTGALSEAQTLLELAACCEQELPERIGKIHLDRNGAVTLYDRSGLQIKLGSGGDYASRIAALPKALRICEADRTSLRYLDASDPGVFYQKWNHTISSKTDGVRKPVPGE